MRTTVNLDSDVYEVASLYAKGRGVTLGTAIGELVRKGQNVVLSDSPSPRLVRRPNEPLVVASRGRTITSEMVEAALEEDD